MEQQVEGSQEPVEQVESIEQSAPDTSAAPSAEPEKPVDPDAGLGPIAKKIKEAQSKLSVTETPPEKEKTPEKVADKAPVPPKAPPGKAAAPAPETPAFVPKTQFRAANQDHPIPDFLKSAMKDEQSQKAVVELLEKAHGLDAAKETTQRHFQARQQAEGAHAELAGQINQLKQMYNRNDLDGFFKRLNIPEERVLQYVLDKVNYSKLPVDQRQVIDAQRSAEQRAWQAEEQVAQSQVQQQAQLSQAVQHALDLSLAAPEVKSVSEAYDTRVGRPGAFREEVANRGHFYWVTQGKLIPPEQAVKEVLALVGTQPAPHAAPAPQAGMQPQAPAQGAPPPAAGKKTPVIPNVGGRSSSPMPQKPRSIQELKDLAKNM